MKYVYKILIVTLMLFVSLTALHAQCNTSLGNGTAASQGIFGQPWRQSFQVTCTGKLATIVLRPTNAGSSAIDVITPADNIRTSLRLLNASNVVIANATIGGLAFTNTWSAGNTYTFDFSAANITLNANTTYRWELFNIETISNQPIDIGYLAISNNNPYALGNATIGGINYPNGDVHNWQVNINALLPVKWISVSGNLNNQKQAIINFTVAENNVAQYQLEKSLDGINFTKISVLNSSGNGDNTYRIIDAQVLNNINYYRVKQIDVDGRFSFSPIVKITADGTSNLSVYPNPVGTTATISGATVGSQIQLLDVTGKLLQSIRVTNPTFTIDMSGYSKGLYLLQGSNQVIKIVKE